MSLWFLGLISFVVLVIAVVAYVRAGRRPPIIHQNAVLDAFPEVRAITGTQISERMSESHFTILEEGTLIFTLEYLEKTGKVEGWWIDGPGRDRMKNRLYKVKLVQKVEELHRLTPPMEVQLAVGSAMKYPDLLIWWNGPHRLFGQSPKELWAVGRKEEVLNFIQSAKSGDMA